MSGDRRPPGSGMTLVKTQLRGGLWEGLLACGPDTPAPPRLVVFHPGGEIENFTLQPVPPEAGGHDGAEAYLLRIPLGTELITDGVHLVTIAERASGAVLGRITVAADAEADEDLRAELRLLRAELDLLKRAFRRHCVETASERAE